MADLTVTALNVGVPFPEQSEIYAGTLVEDMTAGQVCYFDSNGKLGVADANAAGKQQGRGIVLKDGKAGETVDFIKKGFVSGFTITQAYDAPLFVSDTAGALADAAGTLTVPCGRVAMRNDFPTLTKQVYVDFDWSQNFS